MARSRATRPTTHPPDAFASGLVVESSLTAGRAIDRDCGVLLIRKKIVQTWGKGGDGKAKTILPWSSAVWTTNVGVLCRKFFSPLLVHLLPPSDLEWHHSDAAQVPRYTMNNTDSLDSRIVEQFGPLPDGVDLTENNMKHSSLALVALISIAVLVTCLRHMSRLIQGAGLKADDYLVTVGLVCINPLG